MTRIENPDSFRVIRGRLVLDRQHAGGYEALLEGAAGLGVELLKTSSNGYVDLLIEARIERRQRLSSTRNRREKTCVASSATVQGKVSIGCMTSTWSALARVR